MSKPFTGKDMTMVLVAGFGVVVAVNLFMATMASRSFSGVVVENSYVASQKFNGWLESARQAENLGWTAEVSTDADRFLVVQTEGVPSGATVSAQARRPLGEDERKTIEMVEVAPDRFRSNGVLGLGRWIIRLTISSAGAEWVREVPLG